jgi:hypothetical protein
MSADRIKALVDAGSRRDVDTVIVDGKVLVQARARGRGGGLREGARLIARKLLGLPRVVRGT